MKLWHGTSAASVPRILEEGLAPRGSRRSLWAAASHPGAVYLTDSYAMHFAANASAGGEMALVEVDTELLPDRTPLVADEDALWGLWKAGRVDVGNHQARLQPLAIERQVAFFAESLPMWKEAGFGHEESIRTIGNCAFLGTVPPEAVTRVVTYPPDGAWRLRWHDPLVSLANYRWIGPECRAAQLVFGGRGDEARGLRSLFGEAFPVDEMESEIGPLRSLVHDVPPPSNPLTAM